MVETERKKKIFSSLMVTILVVELDNALNASLKLFKLPMLFRKSLLTSECNIIQLALRSFKGLEKSGKKIFFLKNISRVFGKILEILGGLDN